MADAARRVTITLSMENSQYIAKLNETSAATDKLASNAEKAAATQRKGMVDLTRLTNEQRQAMTHLGTGLTAAGVGVTTLAALTLKTGISYNTLQQQSRAALTTLTGSLEDANAQMDKLDEFARTSPFSKETFIQAQQQMLGFGIEAQKVIPYLDSIQDAVAAFGGSGQQISEIAFIMSQISAAGKITATDLMQFGQRGVDAATLIGSQMGKTGAQIREDITAGTLGADQALDALAAGMGERFDGAAENVKATMTGAFDRVQAAWRDLAADMTKPLVDPNGGGFLVDVTNDVADLLRTLNELPGPVKQTVGALGGLAGVGMTAAGGFLLLAPRIAETRAALSTLGVTAASTRASLLSVRTGIKAAAGLAGIALASTDAADGLGLTNTAAYALMGTMAGPWGAAIGGAAGFLMDLSAGAKNAQAALDGFNNAITMDDADTAGERIKVLEEEIAAFEKRIDDFNKGGGIGGMFDTITGPFRDPGTALANWKNSIEGVFGDSDVEEWQKKLAAARKELAELNSQGAAQEMAALADVGAQLGGAAEGLDSFTTAVERLQGTLSGRADMRAFEESIDQLAAKAKELGDASDLIGKDGLFNIKGPAEAREVEALFDGVVSGAANAAEGLAAVEQAATFDRARNQLISLADSMNIPRSAIRPMLEDLRTLDAQVVKPEVDAETSPAEGKLDDVERHLDVLDGIFAVPKADADTGAAKGKVDSLERDLKLLGGMRPRPTVDANDQASPKIRSVLGLMNSLPASKSTTLTTTIRTIHETINLGARLGQRRAAGGPVYGPGTSTSDSIPAMLSNGEYVVQAAAVNRYGLGLLHDLNAMRLAGGGLASRPDVALAAGGTVTEATNRRQFRQALKEALAS